MNRWFFPINRWLEPILAITIALALAYDMWFLVTVHYLPQPFFYEPGDTWMDWFNSAYWAYDKGAYEVWNSVYPPLTFVFIRLLGKASCYTQDTGAFEGVRYCDWVGVVTLHAIYIINIILISIVFIKIDRKTAISRSFALSAGLPMLFALERGNVFMACFTCMLVAYGPLVKSARIRWLGLGLAINFKIYLLTTLMAQLLQRRWRWFEGGAIATVLVYLATYAIQQSGSLSELYATLTVESIFEATNLLDLWFTTTYNPLIAVLNGNSLPMTALLGSDMVEYGLIILPLSTRIVQAIILSAFVATWLRPEVVPRFRLMGIAIALAVITTETSGYSPALVILFVFMEKWEGIGRKWAILAAYIFCIPADIAIDHVGAEVRFSFLGGRNVLVEYFLMLGPFLRPLILMSLPCALSCVTIRQVWLDIRRRGWQARWRFRNDAPIMVGEGVAMRP